MKYSTDIDAEALSAPRPLIHGLTRDALLELCAAAGQPAFRARQLWDWLYVKQVDDWAAMTNLPAAFRAWLDVHVSLAAAVPVEVVGAPNETRKIVVGLRDGERVEEVLIPAADRRTVCVSSQAGCKFRCAFCASGQAGFRRNLAAGEIVGQVVLAARVYGERPTHIVFMGIGEPLDNLDNVLTAIRILHDPDGIGIGARRITVSTCGIVPGIERLAGSDPTVELSVSLHAPADALRAKLMPVNARYPIADVLRACRAYFDATKRLVTFEYTLIGEVNDARADAEALARLLKALPCRVNLIPLSPVEEFDGRPPAPGRAELFIDILARAGINATLRASKGSALQAACGQLRYRRPGV